MSSARSFNAPPRLGSKEVERVPMQVVIGARNGTHRLSAEVIDISVAGTRLRTLNPLRPGQSFWLTLPKIAAIEMRVVWAEGFVSGCTFTKALAPYVLQLVVDAANQANDLMGHTDRRETRRV